MHSWKPTFLLTNAPPVPWSIPREGLRGKYHHQVCLYPCAFQLHFASLVFINLAVQHQNLAHIQAEDYYVDYHL